LGASPGRPQLKNALRAPRMAGGRAFRSNSSDLPMQILRDFRFNPWRMGEQ
jgi:hypothetical protein